LSEPLFEVNLTSQEKQAIEELLGIAILNLAYQCHHHHHHSVQLSNAHLSWEEILTLETPVLEKLRHLMWALILVISSLH
jgi:hypothetical protein